MIDLNTNSEQLDVLDAEIDKAREEVADTYDTLAQAEHALLIKKETAIFKAKYDSKMTDITAKSQSVVLCEEELKAVMMADSKQKRAQMKLAKALDHKETLREQAYNVRCQMKQFGG